MATTMTKSLSLMLFIFLSLTATLSHAGSLEDNYIKKLDREISKMEKFASGEKKMNPSQAQRSFPKKIASYEKKIAKLRKKDGSGDRLQAKLDEYKALFEKAKNATASFDDQKLAMLSDDDIAFAEPAADFLADNAGNISVHRFRYSTPFSQLAVDSLLNSLSNWQDSAARADALVAKLQPAMQDDTVRTLLSRKSEKTLNFIDQYPKLKQRLAKFPTEAMKAVDEEIARMNQEIAKTKAETFKESYYNGFVGESNANQALRAMENLAKASVALGTANASAIKAKVDSARKHYDREKQAKAKKVIDNNAPQADVYAGSDLPAMKAHATKLFGQQVGLPVVRVSVLSKAWKKLTAHTYRNGTWHKRVYSVIRATTYAKLSDGYVGEFQGFLYMNKDDQLTDYEVASYNKGKDVPPSNKIHANKF